MTVITRRAMELARAASLAVILATALANAKPCAAQAGTAAASTPESSAESAVRSVLDAQVGAWNRGDIPGFMAGYENSPETTFIGKNVTHGWAEVLQHYREHYTSRAMMGTLTFDELGVRMLDAQIAVVTGRYHLSRTEGDHAQDSGIFSLVFRRGAGGWKIVLDHTA